MVSVLIASLHQFFRQINDQIWVFKCFHSTYRVMECVSSNEQCLTQIQSPDNSMISAPQNIKYSTDTIT